MTPEFAIELIKSMIFQTTTIAAPILMVGMSIGLGISLFQAVTSISEQTLSFVPKALGILSLLVMILPWLIRTVMEYTVAVISRMPDMVR